MTRSFEEKLFLVLTNKRRKDLRKNKILFMKQSQKYLEIPSAYLNQWPSSEN